jgi:hypothetical protein
MELNGRVGIEEKCGSCFLGESLKYHLLLLSVFFSRKGALLLNIF